MVVTVPRAPSTLQTPPRPREDLPRHQSTHDPSCSPPLHARSSGASPPVPPFPGYPGPQPWKEEFCFPGKLKGSKRVQKRPEERARMRCLAVPPPGSVLP